MEFILVQVVDNYLLLSYDMFLNFSNYHGILNQN